MTTSPSAKKRWWRGLGRLVFFGAFLFVLSLSWLFVHHMRVILAQPINSWFENQTADCGVVLTGGPNRIREGFDLLVRRDVQKLIISGVHPKAELRDIFPQWPYYGELREQNVILERRSRSTYGNAVQTLPLVEALRCRDIVLVTSRIHMVRALRTFRAEFPPDYPILARTVVSSSFEPGWGEVGMETLKSIFYLLLVY